VSSDLDELRQLWRRTGLESYIGVGYVVRVWNVKDTAQTHIVKGIHLVVMVGLDPGMDAASDTNTTTALLN